MNVRCKECDRRVPWHYVGLVGGGVIFVALVGLGLVAAMGIYDGVKYSAGVRESVRHACISGNENACRIYTVDYGKESTW